MQRDRLSSIDPKAAELLFRRLNSQGRGRLPQPAITRRPRAASAPQSSAQLGIFLAHQLSPDAGLYRIPLTAHLRGPLRVEGLARALRAVLTRHESLRTTFVLEGSEARQLVQATATVALPVLDLGRLGNDDRQRLATVLAERFQLRPFDLERGPMLRALLLSWPPASHELLLTLHHIAADYWSVAILTAEISAVYTADLEGAPAALRSLPIQYSDFAWWEQEQLANVADARHLDFWRQTLREAPHRLALPSDRERGEQRSLTFGRAVLALPPGTAQDLAAFNRVHGSTPFHVFAAAFAALIGRWAEQGELVFATPVSTRDRPELEGLIGLFVNLLPHRVRLPRGTTFAALVQELKSTTLAVHEHRGVPFARIIEALGIARDRNFQPLSQLIFNVFDGARPQLTLPGVEVERVDAAIGTLADLDLLLTTEEGGWKAYLRYDLDLFDQDTITHLTRAFEGLLAAALAAPAEPLDNLPWPGELAAQAARSRRRQERLRIAVAASFTAEPLAEPLGVLLNELRLGHEVVFAPYQQILQSLFAAGGCFFEAPDSVNVVLLRWSDLVRYHRDRARAQGEVEQLANELAAALRAAIVRRPASWLVAFPPEPADADPSWTALTTRLTAELSAALADLPGVAVIEDAARAELYPVVAIFDRERDELGHIPFTDEYFAALALLLARRIHGLRWPAPKVLVLDCDQTLWVGVCAEDGALGVRVDAGRRFLQQLLLRQQAAGALLCLASKNREEDVLEVFDAHPEMVLRREHLTAWQINWQPKSKSLERLAALLDLGLDSFLLIDDNPVECAEVRANCPQVAVLELPADEADLVLRLRHCWFFDRGAATSEDRQRTALYRRQFERESFRATTPGLSEFLDGLGLVIDLHEIQPDEIARVAQLTQRTNQFNATTKRRTQAELEALLHPGALAGLAVRVADRFGDYGLVGAALFRPVGGALAIDTLLLSCRVLGRGVEWQLLGELARRAVAGGLAELLIPVIPTAKNQPLRDFLGLLPGARREEGGEGYCVRLVSAAASSFTFRQAARLGRLQGPEAEVAPSSAVDFAAGERNAAVCRIATELAEPAAVVAAARRGRRRPEATPGAFVAPRSPAEAELAALYGELLGRAEVGATDSLFALGGDSLTATLLVARLRQRHGLDWTLQPVFDAPTVAELAVRIERAVAAQAEAPLPPAGISIPRLSGPEPEGGFALSFAQERLWFLDHMAPGSPVYHEPSLTLLAGALVPRRLVQALAAVHQRHDSLRTTFHLTPEGPRQHVAATTAVRMPVVDLAGLRERVAAAELRRLGRRFSLLPFDLGRGPLLRLCLARLTAARHGLIAVFHHIIADGISFGIFARDLAAAYARDAAADPPRMNALDLRYVDFAAWQRQHLTGERRDGLLTFWQQQLAGFPPALELPLDRPRPAVQSFAGARLPIALDRGVIRGLRRLAQAAETTLFVVLLLGLGLTLARTTRQRRLLLGTPVSGRDHAATEEMVGLFVNTLVLPLALDEATPIAEAVAALRRTTQAAMAHAELPFERLVEALHLARDTSRNPLVQVLFALQPAAPPEGERGGLTFSSLPLPAPAAKFELLFDLRPEREALAGWLEFQSDLFDATTVQRLARRWAHILAALAEAPAGTLATLPTLASAEGQQLLQEWNDSASPLPPVVSLASSFFAAAAHTPEAIALSLAGESLSYAALAAQVHAWAIELGRRGVAPEVPVAILSERSLELVIGLLAILTAGGAYLPLDPSLPRERLALMLDEARVPLVVTAGPLPADFPLAGREELRLSLLPSPVAAGAATEPATPAEGAAYILYTSGSTGKPKGVINTHRGIHNRIRWMQRQFELGPADRVLQKTPATFDVSVWEFFWPLAVGAELVLAEPGGHRDARYLAKVIDERRINVLHFVPSMLQIFVGEDRVAERLTSLSWVIASGEALPRELTARFGELSAAGFANLYGPTEAAVDVTCHVVDTRHPPPKIPIGRPIDNLRLAVLDPRAQPVGIGVPGDLVIGGVGLARGYLAQPGLTALRFVPQSFGAEPGARVYRTGDLARYLPNGELEFLGRTDFQVKLRGLRIELGEIETALLAVSGVREAVVVVYEQGALGPRLVGYVVGAFEASSEASAAMLRKALTVRLPDYMVPAEILVLPALPLSPNGKLDRAALPAPELRRAAAGPVAEPRSDLERRLLAIWRRVLRREEVGLQANFFDLGGHSLLLIELQRQLAAELGAEVPVVDLFRYPTITALAGLLSSQHEVNAAREEGRRRAARRRQHLAAEGIAIIGLAGRFPGAPDIATLWRNLLAGHDASRELTDEELAAAGVDPAAAAAPHYVRRGAPLADADLFDASFFGFTPREAETMDPQHRQFLEVAWQALEDAGYDSLRTPGAVGVFAGSNINSYLLTRLAADGELIDPFEGLALRVAGDKDYLATRASYKLDLRGPSFTVQSACSTSLVALHLACQALLTGECEMALVGGVSLLVPQTAGYAYLEGAPFSRDGVCRAFDAEASGTFASNGVAAVVLKPLSAALRDGDSIRAVIRGSAINSDGAQKVGYSAPSVEGQTAVIAEALAFSAVDAATIGFVEAHGTGTALGDPIEVAALAAAYGGSARRGSCALGSIKTNLGHLDAAAGVTGLIKAALALEHRLIPPSLHYISPNPQIRFDDTPFFVNQTLRPFPAYGGPRRAAVSSFGLGGTNAHVVLEEAPPRAASAPGRGAELLLLSAKTATALERATTNLAEHLRRDGSALADVAYTTQLGRRALRHRRFLVAATGAEAADDLSAVTPGRAFSGQASEGRRTTVFLFPGGGSQYVNMARDLYASEAVFRAEVEGALALLPAALAGEVRAALYPTAGAEEGAASELRRVSLALPALFIVEYATARLLMSWGITPGALIGHSLGEYTAACLAGVFSLADALAQVVLRGRLIEALPAGAMATVPLPEAEVLPLLGTELAVAAVNAPGVAVVSGPASAVESFVELLAQRGVEASLLHIRAAGHSPMIDPILEEFGAFVRGIERCPPSIPIASNLSGTWLSGDEAVSAQYWVRHLRHTVRFADGLATVLADPAAVLLEVGPGRSLGSLVRQHPRLAGQPILATLHHAQEDENDLAFLLTTVGRLWLAGVEIDWEAFHRGFRRRRLPLPTYPFEGRRFWLEPARGQARRGAASGRFRRAEEWTASAGWRRSPGRRPPAAEPQNLRRVTPELLAEPGAAALLTAAAEGAPAAPILLFEAGAFAAAGAARPFAAWRALVTLAAELHRAGRPANLWVLTDGALALDRRDVPDPEQAALLGVVRSLSLEEPSIHCHLLDVPAGEEPCAYLASELAAPSDELAVAYRGGERWVECFETLPPAPAPAASSLADAAFLCVGLEGEPARLTAESLLRETNARLLVISSAGERELDGERDALAGRVLRRGWTDDPAALAAWLEETEVLVGSLTGVLIEPGEGAQPVLTTLDEMDPAASAENLGRELARLRVVLDALGPRRPGTVVLHASLSSVLGGLGLAADAALYAALDAELERRLGARALRWMSLHWDAVERTAVGPPPATTGYGTQLREQALSGAEVFATLLHALGAGARGPLVISTTDLARRRQRSPQGEGPEREAAPAAGHLRPDLGTAFVAPRDEAELAVAQLMGRLLGIEQVGIHDNFFELGGHSLLATQLASRVRDQFGVAMPLRSLFDNPTAAAIAAAVRREMDGSGDQRLEAILSEIEGLGDEELTRLLAEESVAPTAASSGFSDP